MKNRLKELWSTGASMAQCAAILNIEFPLARLSRNAVAGMIYRQGLQRPVTGGDSGRRIPRHTFWSKLAGGSPGPTQMVIYAPFAPVGLMDANYHHCRWIVAERGKDGLAMFCGGKAVRGRYCAYHAGRVYERQV